LASKQIISGVSARDAPLVFALAKEQNSADAVASELGALPKGAA